MSPRRPLLLAALLATLAACQGDTGPHRNLILISLDTTRADRLSCYGYERETTPNLDRFAAESVLFENCTSQSTATAPSHMSLFTGQHVRRHGLLDNGKKSFPPRTLASILKDAGWSTAGFVGHGSVREEFGHGVGFEEFVSWKSVGIRGKSFASRNLPEVLPDALRWLDEHQAEPFFLLVHGYDPHCPFDPDEAHERKFAGWYEGSLDLTNKCGYVGFQSLFEEGGPVADDLRYVSDMYDAELNQVDVVLGGFFDQLRERGLLENTVVVFTSDHGEVLGDHGWIGHTRTWEPEIRVPLIVRFPPDVPGVAPGTVPDPVMHVDVLPTVLSALGVPVPEDGLQGVDLMPLLRGGRPAEDLAKRMRLTQVADLKMVRFDERWKIVFGEDRRKIYPHGALFDLVSDPGEEVNLIETPEGRERFDALLKRYERWEKLSAPEDELFAGYIPAPLDPEEQARIAEELGGLGYAEGDGR